MYFIYADGYQLGRFVSLIDANSLFEDLKCVLREGVFLDILEEVPVGTYNVVQAYKVK